MLKIRTLIYNTVLYVNFSHELHTFHNSLALRDKVTYGCARVFREFAIKIPTNYVLYTICPHYEKWGKSVCNTQYYDLVCTASNTKNMLSAKTHVPIRVKCYETILFWTKINLHVGKEWIWLYYTNCIVIQIATNF